MAEAAPNLNPSPGDTAAEDFSVSMPESWRRKPEPPTRPASPADRIALIENSQRCLTNGWLTLVPVVGAFFVIPAVRRFQRVDRERGAWNPAAHLWLRGLVLACFGYWANLVWWWFLVSWLGEATGTIESGDTASMFVLCLFSCGSAPGVLGLGLAAARWPTCFGAFVLRRYRELYALVLVGYMVLGHRMIQHEWSQTGMRPSAEPPSERFVQWALILWLFWLLPGFVIVARRGNSSWWWVGWLFGGALLALWASSQ